MALLLVIGVAYNLAKSYEENGLQSAMIATSIFILLIPQVAKIRIDDLCAEGSDSLELHTANRSIIYVN